jgi:hypothetical protein
MTSRFGVVQNSCFTRVVQAQHEDIVVTLGKVPHGRLFTTALALFAHTELEKDVVFELLLVVDHHQLLSDLFRLGILLVQNVLLAVAFEHPLVGPFLGHHILPKLLVRNGVVKMRSFSALRG